MGEINLNEMSKIDEIDFVEKIYPVYKAIKKVSEHNSIINKNIIGFVGAPWTLLVYMINQQSPKKKIKERFL
jgi:uroporphyrinogen decarboxylase